MATIYRCDRCKKEFVGPDHVAPITIPEPSFHYKDLGFKEGQAKSYDLCKACVEHIIKEITSATTVETTGS